MWSVSIRDADGLDPARPSAWLEIGRECRPSLQTPHRVALLRQGEVVASAAVHRRGDSGVQVDLRPLPADMPRSTVAALTYLALREARIAGRNSADIEPGSCAGTVCEILRPRQRADGALHQRVDYGMHHAFDAAGADLQGLLADTFPSEVVRTVEDHLHAFFTAGKWAGTIRRGEISRDQYVATLFNFHSYVRYTTRLLGYCIGLSSDGHLRAHYIEHLKGEINHERIIERDLANLGEDVEYVVRHLQPTPATMRFMFVQESLVSFYRDPVLFLTCPIAAESYAAYLQEDLLEGLGRSARAWGFDDPAGVIHFLKSHTGFDGGPEGHWNLCVEKLRDHVRDGARMQRFSSILHNAMSALAGIFESGIIEHTEP